MKITKNLTEGNIYRSMLAYAIPLLLSSMLTQLYSTVDGVIAGKCIGEFALGAISSTASFEILFRSLADGFCVGFGIYLSHLFGAREFGSIKRDIRAAMTLIVCISLAVSLVAILLRNPILDYLKVDPTLRTDAETYFVIYTAGYAVLYGNMMLVVCLNTLGITSFSLYVSLLSALLNAGGNLLTVLVFGMGVAGLALSTLLSALAATVIYLLVLRRAFREMPSEAEGKVFDFSGVRRSLRYSLPAALQMLTFHGVAFLISPAINGLGAAASTGYNVSTRLYNIGTIGLWATTSALTCYTGQCVGGGDSQKIKRGLRVGFLLNALVVLPFVLVLSGLATPIVSIFFPSEHGGEAFGYALRYARIYLPLIYIQLVGHILHSYMRSLGAVTTVLGITIVGCITRISATLLLIPRIEMDGVYLGQVISWTVDMLLSIVLWFFLYRTEAHIERSIRKATEKKTAAVAK